MSDENKELVEGKDNLPMEYDFEQMSGANEDFHQDDLTTPFLKVLQKLSPELDTVDGAKAGMFYNTSTQKLYEGVQQVVPVAYARQFLEWVPREQGGGFRGEVSMKEALELDQNERGQGVTDEGNLVVDTRLHYVLHITDEGAFPCIVTFKSTGIKRSKNWNDIANSIIFEGSKGPYNPPWFSHIYNLEATLEQKNDDKWHLMKASKLAKVDDPELIRSAMAFRELVKSNGVKVDHEKGQDSASLSLIHI